MRKTLIMTLVLFGIFLIQCDVSYSQVQAGVSIGDEGLRGFYVSVGEYYRVPEREVIVVRERRIPDEEIPVVFFLASRAHIAPATVIDMRLAGKSWMDISLHYGLGADIFYVPVKITPGPPYGNAYGYYRNKPQREWKKIMLEDNDVVNLVNLRFMSEHYRYSPDEVIRLRARGNTFIKINERFVIEKKGKKGKSFSHGKEKHEKTKEHKNGKGEKN